MLVNTFTLESTPEWILYRGIMKPRKFIPFFQHLLLIAPSLTEKWFWILSFDKFDDREYAEYYKFFWLEN